MKKNKINFMYCGVITIVLLISSCKNSAQSTEIVIPSNKKILIGNERSKTNQFLELVTGMKIVKLDSSADDNVMGEIHKVIVEGNKIYLLDKVHTNSIHIYSIDGNYLNVLSRIGQGEGDYIKINDFQIDQDENELIILDGNNRKLLFYDLVDLNYRKTIKLDFYVNSFGILSDSNLVLDRGNYITDESDNTLAIVSKNDGKVKQTFLSRDSKLSNFTFSPLNQFFYVGRELMFQPCMSNMIYKISKEKAEIDRYFDFGKCWISEEFIIQNSKNHPMDIMNNMKKNEYILFLNIVESENHYVLNYYKGSDKIVTFVDKKSKKELSFLWDKDLKESFDAPISSHNDKLIAIRYNGDENPTLVFLSLKSGW